MRGEPATFKFRFLKISILTFYVNPYPYVHIFARELDSDCSLWVLAVVGHYELKSNIGVIALLSLLFLLKETLAGRIGFFAIKIGPLPMRAKVHH